MTGMAIVCWPLVVVFLFKSPTDAVNVKTPLYERCSHFKEKYRSTKCSEYPNYDCQAEAVPNGYFNASKYYCTSDCPPPPENVTVTFFKQPRYLNGNLFAGINISWAVAARDNWQSSRVNLYEFRLELRSSRERMVVAVTVNTSRQLAAANSSRVWFQFDCFYPIRKNQTWTLTVGQMPYNPESGNSEVIRQFSLDRNGDPVTDPKYTKTTTVTDIKLTTGDLKMMNATTDIYPPVRGSKDSSLNSTSFYKVVTGFAGGLFVVLIAILSICFFRRKIKCLRFDWHNQKLCLTWKKKPDNITSNGHSDNHKIKSDRMVLLIYMQSNLEHIQRSKDLSLVLKKLCHVTDLCDLENNHRGSTERDVECMIKKAQLIIAISSDYTVKAMKQIQCNAPVSSSYGVHALHILLKHQERIASRVIIVYFPEEKNFRILDTISRWCPLALPASLSTVCKLVQDLNFSTLIPADAVHNSETVERIHSKAVLDDSITEDCNTMDLGKSDYASLECFPSVMQLETESQCPDLYSSLSGRTVFNIRKPDVMAFPEGFATHCRSHSAEPSFPYSNLDSGYSDKQNILGNFDDTSSFLYQPGVDDSNFINRGQSVFVKYIIPPQDCISVDTNISSYVDAINRN